MLNTVLNIAVVNFILNLLYWVGALDWLVELLKEVR